MSLDLDDFLLNKSNIFITWNFFDYMELSCKFFYAFESNTDNKLEIDQKTKLFDHTGVRRRMKSKTQRFKRFRKRR